MSELLRISILKSPREKAPTPDFIMIPTLTLCLVATWFLFGMARLVFSSRMVELRIDNPDPSEAIAFTWAAAQQRVNPVNYDRRGLRLLPWYRAVTTTYWLVVACACGWTVHFG